MKKVYLFFLPGCAGNFISRCITMFSDDICCWAPNDKIIELTIDEKYELLTYKHASKFKSWSGFELAIHPVCIVHEQLPNHLTGLEIHHPEFIKLSEESIKFYVNPHQCYDWAIFNAIKKDSYQDLKWYKNGRIMLNSPDYYKIKLINVISNETSFMFEMKQIADMLKIAIPEYNEKIIMKLWKEWQLTIIPLIDIPEFKKTLGWEN